MTVDVSCVEMFKYKLSFISLQGQYRYKERLRYKTSLEAVQKIIGYTMRKTSAKLIGIPRN